MIELKPCPFCGGKAVMAVMRVGHRKYVDRKDKMQTYFAICADCSIRTMKYKTEEQAAERWNRREKE